MEATSVLRSRILIVDDEEGMLEVCSDTLAGLPGAEIVAEMRSQIAANRLSSENWDMLIADIRMPGLSGVDLLRLAREKDPTMAVLLITAFPSVETAVESMKLGATDYITKPFLPADLLATVRGLLQARQLREENSLLVRHVERAYSFGSLLGKSTGMRNVFDTIRKVAPTNADVLILGETGTGKELVARSIHHHSDRNGKRFVPVDCGAIPEDLLESEFFGYEKGAFTGANNRSMGLLEFAHGGTFFLDEIGELPLRLQAKLLRTLQERRVRRLGAKEEIKVDVRVIAATARDLDQEIVHQRFRSDLYYRINVARVEMPPLRERPEDIELFTRHFLDRFGREMGREGIDIAPEALEVLVAYSWPGNVRELQNVVKRTLAMTRTETICAADLPDEVVAAAGLLPGKGRPGYFDLREQHVGTFEKNYLTNLLRTHRGEVSAAAADAQLPRGTLYRLLKNHGINANDFRE
jgi:two-component system, NtrC family, response regulator PilR